MRAAEIPQEATVGSAQRRVLITGYAKMADDDSLRTLADRIQARAVSRMGALLKQFNNGVGRPKEDNRGGGAPISQAEAGRRSPSRAG